MPYHAVIQIIKGGWATIKMGWKMIIKFISNLPSILMYIGKWIIDAIKESIAQVFTLLGFFIAWFTLNRVCTRHCRYRHISINSNLASYDIYSGGLMPEGLSSFKKIKIIIMRMLAVFIANGLAVIGAGSLIGVDTVSSVLLAGSLGVIKVSEALARAYIDDGKITLDEINESFAIMDKKEKVMCYINKKKMAHSYRYAIANMVVSRCVRTTNG